MSPKPHRCFPHPQAKPRLFSRSEFAQSGSGLLGALQFLAETLWERLGEKTLPCVTSRFGRAVDRRAAISRTSGFPSISALFSLTVTCRIQNSKLCCSGLIGTPQTHQRYVSASLIRKGGWPWDTRQGWSFGSNSRDFRQEALPFPLLAQRIKNLPAMQEAQEMRVRSLNWEDPLEEGMATHSSVLAWRIPMDRGACRAAVHGVTKSQTRLSN